MTQLPQTQQPFFFVTLPRLVAKSLGLTRYITLDPCAQGHAISRYVSDGQCVQCCRDKLKARYQKDPEKWSNKSKEYRKNNLDLIRQRNNLRTKELRKSHPEKFTQWEKNKRLRIIADPVKYEKEKLRQLDKQKRAYWANPDKYKSRAREYRKDPEKRIIANQKCKEYKKKNPEVIAELNRKHNPLRRAAVIQRTPPWLTDDHKQAMYEIYKAAHSQGLHVDHIVPLRGKTVSGLHVPWNLRPLSPTENSRKRNNFEVEQ